MVYKVIDLLTNQTVGTYKSIRRAYRRADKLDLAYGMVRYYVLPVSLV